jgi:mannosylglycoprotein endo-beta-mannosidase
MKHLCAAARAMAMGHLVVWGSFCGHMVVVAASSSYEVHTGWKACRPPRDPSRGCGSDDNNTTAVWKVRTLPTTALTVLVDHQQIPGAAHVTMDNLYASQNLQLLPDIATVGRDYYTLLYEVQLPPTAAATGAAGERPRSDRSGATTTTRQTLRVAGINYHARAWLNGQRLVDLNDDRGGAGVPGMFVRRLYNVTGGGRFNLLVLPPYHPGDPSSGGQGGNHALAQDGATAQYMLGWDWCQAMPDRATGFFGSVVLEGTAGALALVDPAIHTVHAVCAVDSATTACTSVTLRILAHVEGLREELGTTNYFLQVRADWGETWRIVPDTHRTGFNMHVTVDHPHELKLWWPHGVGMEPEAHLHSFQFSLMVNGKVSDTKTIQVGIRTIETFLDEDIQGQRFRINGKDIYLVGGNWIGTDQTLRYSASTQRYCNEISLHKHAGLNLIRVWGGGVAERDQFYECADRLGVLVFQEFWMTGTWLQSVCTCARAFG